jgi:predicted dehydrogenase
MSGAEPIRVGFIGAGGICEQRHLPGLKQIPGVELIAVSNRSPESSGRIQALWGFERIERDWQKVVSAGDIDAVFIGTWPYLHKELSLATLAAGKHVFCQARMCMDWGEAREMVAAADAQPRLVNMVCPSPFRVRWERTVKRLLAEGPLGELRSVVVLSTSGANRDPHAVTWRERRDLSGLNVLQMGIFAETLHAWCGEYASLAATTAIPIPTKHDAGRPVTIEVPQLVSIVGKLAGGAMCTEHHTGLAGGPAQAEILLAGQAATCVVDLQAGRVVLAREGGAGRAGQTVDASGDEWRVEQEFIAAVRAARRGETWQVRPDFREAARYMQKTQAVADSAAQGRTIVLAELSC